MPKGQYPHFCYWQRPSSVANLFLFIALICCGITACNRKEPVFVAREDVGKDTRNIYDSMKDQPKYIKIRKRDVHSKDAIKARREERLRLAEQTSQHR